MPQVPADILSEVFSSDNPLSDTITLAASGATLHCYVDERFLEDENGVDTREIVASIPQPLPAGLENGSRVSYNGADYLINAVRDYKSGGLIELVLVAAPAAG